MSLIETVIRLIVAPGVAMRDLADEPGRRWLVPVALAVVFSVAAVASTMDQRAAASRAEVAEQMENVQYSSPEEQAQAEAMIETSYRFQGVLGLVGGAIGPVVRFLAVAGLFHLLGTVLGGQQSFMQMLAVTSWARFPLVFQDALRAIYSLAGGAYDASSSGLSGLVASASGEVGSYAGPVLAEISVWNIWALALLVIAVKQVSRISTRKAAAGVGAFVALKVVAGLAGVALTSALRGITG